MLSTQRSAVYAALSLLLVAAVCVLFVTFDTRQGQLFAASSSNEGHTLRRLQAVQTTPRANAAEHEGETVVLRTFPSSRKAPLASLAHASKAAKGKHSCLL